MKRAVLLSTLVVFLLPVPTLNADEPPEAQLDFVQKLREKGYANLALQYLEKLKKAPPEGFTKEFQKKLPLELARTRISLARQKEPAQRVGLFDEARKDLQALLAADPENSEARIDLAQLQAHKGQALLGQALREPDPKVAEGLKRQAEKQFSNAADELQKAADKAPALAVKVKVLFERARTFLDQAETHAFDDRARPKLVGEAQKALEKVEKLASKDNSNPDLHLARAWLYPSYQRGDEPGKAAAYFRALMREDEPKAKAGQRLVWYFRIQALVANGSRKRGAFQVPPLKKVADFGKYARFLPKEYASKLASPDSLALGRAEAMAWLKAFPGARNTPEGQGVRYELGSALVGEAQTLNARLQAAKASAKDPKAPKSVKLSAQAQKDLAERAARLYKEALPVFAELAATENDYTEQATQESLNLRFLQMGQATPVARLKDFDQCYLKARYEMRKVTEAEAGLARAGGKERDTLMEQRRRHLRTAAEALRRALQLADDSTPFREVADARYFLTYVYLISGDSYRAAVLGEDLARANSKQRSADAARYALVAYGAIAASTKQTADRKRLQALLEFVEAQAAWKDAPVAQVALNEKAKVAISSKKPLEAVNLLEKIAPTYSGYLFTQAQLVIVATGAAKRPETDPKDRKVLLDKAQDALKRLPKLPDNADPFTAQMYLAARLEQGQLLYTAAFELSRKKDFTAAARAYAELDAFQAELKKQYDKHGGRFPPEAQEQFDTALTRMRNLARYGAARMEYLTGNYDRVLAPGAAGDVVAELKKTAGKGAAPIQVQDPRLVAEVLGFAMRADVQKGKIAEATELLGLLRRLLDDSGKEAGGMTGPILRAIAFEATAQRQQLKKNKDGKKLAEMDKHFAAFFDGVVRESKNASAEQLALFASLYASQGKHDRAIELYARIPEPKIPVKQPYGEAEKRELQEYWQAQVNYGHELRVSEDPAKETKALALARARARKILLRALAAPHAHPKLKFLAEKELLHLLEDEGQYAKGFPAWSKLMSHPQMKAELRSIRPNTTQTGQGKQGKKLESAEERARRTEAEEERARKINETYYDCYYHYLYCYYQFGKNHPVAARGASYVKGAVDRALRLRSSNPKAWELVSEKFQDLCKKEPLFAFEYARGLFLNAQDLTKADQKAAAVQEAAAELVRLEADATARAAVGARIDALLGGEPLLRAEYKRQKGK